MGEPAIIEPIDERICKFCSSPLVRRVLDSGKHEDMSKFRGRNYCDRSCAAKSKVGLKYGKKEALARAIQETPPPPCEKPAKCIHYQRCATEQLACGDFLQYAALATHSVSEVKKKINAGRFPTKRHYNSLFDVTLYGGSS